MIEEDPLPSMNTRLIYVPIYLTARWGTNVPFLTIRWNNCTINPDTNRNFALVTLQMLISANMENIVVLPIMMRKSLLNLFTSMKEMIILMCGIIKQSGVLIPIIMIEDNALTLIMCKTIGEIPRYTN